MNDYNSIMEALGGVDKALTRLYFMEGMDSVRSNLENIANLLQDELLEMEAAGTPNRVIRHIA